MTAPDTAPAPPAGDPSAHTLSNGQQVVLPPHDQFYAQFVVRNRGLVPPEEQDRLRRATILVAGCGSIGGAVVEPLVRLGAEHLILAEPGDYDLHNLNRQAVRLQDLGRNKALVFQERMRDINPYAEIAVDTHGIVAENVASLVAQATLIVDGVDVTTKPPLSSKYALHEQARQRGIPVISGYDIAGLQLLRIYDYRRPGVRILDGAVRPDGPELREPMAFLRRVIPIAAVPLEIIDELQQQLRGARDGFPQIVYTANLFGVVALQAILDILSGRPVRRQVIVDVPTLLRPRSTRLRVMAARLYGLYHLNNDFRRTLRKAQDPEELPHAVGGP
ncbi:MAG TPA: ThiF family adenylyltransferase [Thermomicrobiaceae bacterium]|nr:ThiF family adenylyltransferase [Thermomicrobiaceae bacterium]